MVDFLKEENYETEIDKIRMELDTIKVNGTFKGMEDADIYYEYYVCSTEARKNVSVVISHGFCEELLKYTELIHYYLEEGYSVYGIEYRGMSRSTHLAEEVDTTMVHVEDYNYYIEDMKKFIDTIVKVSEPENRLYLMAHSQGGLMGTVFLEQYPEYFEKAILTSPFYRETYNVPRWFAMPVLKYRVKHGKDKCYAPLQVAYPYFPPIEKMHTTSEARYNFNKKNHESLKCIQQAGGSNSWIYECFKAQKKALDIENIKKIKAKLMIVTCGNDKAVLIKEHEKFICLKPDIKVLRMENSQHEPYYEVNEIMEKYFTECFKFLSE